MKTLLLVLIIIYLLITLLMYAVNLSDMVDARRAWIKRRGRFYDALDAGEASLPMSADVLLAAVDAYEDTLDAMRNIWKWPWLVLAAGWKRLEGFRWRAGGARVFEDRALMRRDLAECGLIREVTDE